MYLHDLALSSNQNHPAGIAVGLSGEIISQSEIESGFIWPALDPRSEWQPTRIIESGDYSKAKLLSQSPHFSLDAFLEKTKELDVASKIIELINHNAFQFNSKKRFRECVEWRKRIEECCKHGQPIDILILAFCVISNPTKRIQPTDVTLAEDVSLLHLHNITSHISSFYPPGATFQVISDSTFYALPFGNTSVEAHNYLLKLRNRTFHLGIENSVKILDITDYLSNHNLYFQDRFEFWRQHFLASPVSNDLSQEEYKGWLSSMKCSLNSRRMGFSYKELMGLFGAHSNQPLAHLDDLAKVSLAEYRALKSAAADTNWENIYFPNAIRATIHTKKIPVLGLRLYPKYKLSSRLLPYHGIALVTESVKDGGERMEIVHEISVVGNPRYTKVVDTDGVIQYYEITRPLQ